MLGIHKMQTTLRIWGAIIIGGGGGGVETRDQRKFLSGRGLLAGKVDTDLSLLRLWGYVVMD